MEIAGRPVFASPCIARASDRAHGSAATMRARESSGLLARLRSSDAAATHAHKYTGFVMAGERVGQVQTEAHPRRHRHRHLHLSHHRHCHPSLRPSLHHPQVQTSLVGLLLTCTGPYGPCFEQLDGAVGLAQANKYEP